MSDKILYSHVWNSRVHAIINNDTDEGIDEC